jgi:hypothetical protein
MATSHQLLKPKDGGQVLPNTEKQRRYPKEEAEQKDGKRRSPHARDSSIAFYAALLDSALRGLQR